MTTTPITDDLTTLDVLAALIDGIVSDLDGSAVVTQSRCVDNLLDLWNATTSHSARQVLAETLTEVRYLSAVETSFVQERSALVHLAAAVDEVFDHLELRSA